MNYRIEIGGVVVTPAGATRCEHCGKSHLSERCPSRIPRSFWPKHNRKSMRRGQRHATRAAASMRRRKRASA